MLTSVSAAPLSGENLRRLAWRWSLAIAAIVLVSLLLANFFREPLTGVGRGFVSRFGYAGMAAGTFLADGLQIPVPPQFYMFVAIAAHAPVVPTLAAITLGSLSGGALAFTLAHRVGRVPFIARRLERPRASVERALARWGYWAPVLASFLPIAYSMLCWIAGANRLSPRVYFVLSACRVPRLIAFYYLIRLGWLTA